MKTRKSLLLFLFTFFAYGVSKQKSINDDLIEINRINSNVILDIRYATTNNFTGKKIYPQAKCFLRRGTAKKINRIQKKLEALGLGLKIFDGYRPLSAQFKLYEVFPNEKYVANPYKKNFKGSKHNRGCAVDCTLVDLKTGKELKMPSEFDEFSQKAHLDYKNMDKESAKNCKLLGDIMEKNGFKRIYSEWWHFNDTDWKSYSVLDIAFSEIRQ